MQAYPRYWNEAKETAPREQREAEILAEMQRQLHDVYERLPFYRRHYDAHGFHPSQVKTLADFTERVPVITKQMLREDQERHPPFGSYLGNDGSDVVRVLGSSGTTGRPTLYAYSKRDFAYAAEVQAQGFWTLGVRPSDRVQMSTLFSLFIAGWGGLLAVERIGATGFPIGAGETERQLELMYRIGSTVLFCTPSYALHMLETARQLGYDTAASPLRLGIFLGEPGSSIPATRKKLEEGWGIQVRDIGTTSEMTPWATNCECEGGHGVHVIQDEVWTEIVAKDDPHTALPEGESGGVIYTHLKRESQPMIRFVSGDESYMTYEPCPCGRTYPRLPAGIYGRLDDMLLIRGVNVYPSKVQEVVLGTPGTGLEFRIVLEREDGLDNGTVRVERAPEAAPGDDAQLARDVRHRLKNATNINFAVEVLEPNALERTTGKAKRVEDRRPTYRPEVAGAASS